jgi:adenine deaminase
MKRMVFLFLAFVLAGLLRAQTSPPALVLRGGTLVDVASGNEISNSIIVMRGERIERVGSGNTAAPEDAQIHMHTPRIRMRHRSVCI